MTIFSEFSREAQRFVRELRANRAFDEAISWMAGHNVDISRAGFKAWLWQELGYAARAQELDWPEPPEFVDDVFVPFVPKEGGTDTILHLKASLTSDGPEYSDVESIA